MRNLKSCLGVIAAGTLFASGPAFAHAELVSSTPAKNAVVAAPKTIALTFEEKVVPAFTKVSVTMPMGSQTMQVPVKTRFEKGGKTLVATPTAKLTPGSYIVHWTAAGHDGHKLSGDLPFRVR